MSKKITFFLFKYNLVHYLIFITLGISFSLAVYGKTNLVNKSIRSDEILVKFKDSYEIYKIKISPVADYNNILDQYSLNPIVDWAEPNFIYQASIIPSDKFFNNQWYLKKIGAPDAWDAVRVSPQITIAVVDSGIQIDHYDLKENIWVNKREIPANGQDDDNNGFIDDVNGWDFVNNINDPRPKFSSGFTQDGILHGTIVAGIIAAAGNNNEGVTGITWQAKLMSLKVLDDKGEGDTNSIVKAVDYAINNGADIINLSFAGQGFSQSLDAAIKRAYDAGIVIVAAAGNDELQGIGYSLDKTPIYPACHDGKYNENMVIGVAATDPIDQKANFSSYGFKCVDISSPGVSIYSTSVYAPDKNTGDISFNKYYDGYWSGTSMAAPMISGAVALIESVNPSLSRKQVIDILLQSSDSINRLNPDYLSQLGAGRLNIFKAVVAAKNELFLNNYKIVNAGENGNTEIRITDKNGGLISKFNPYEDRFGGGTRLAAGDINHDGQDEIITGAGAGGGPQVRIFDAHGNVLGQFFAYNKNFKGGVNVAAGDINHDGQDEIITGAGAGGGPQVRIFDAHGNVLGQFFAYNKNFKGGVNVAAGDINHDGQDEIITGAGAGGGPQVRIFDAHGNVLGQFFAYNKNFKGGVNVAAGNIFSGTRSAGEEIITAPQSDGGPQIIIYNSNGQILDQFFSYNKKFRGGVNITSADINNDGIDEIITGAGAGGGPHVRIFTNDKMIIYSYYAYAESFNGGVEVATISIK